MPHPIHVVSEVAHVKNHVEISGLSFFLETRQRPCVLIPHVTVHGKTWGPVGVSWHRFEGELVRPAVRASHVINCESESVEVLKP